MKTTLPLQQADQEALRTLKDTIATISSRLTQLGESHRSRKSFCGTRVYICHALATRETMWYKGSPTVQPDLVTNSSACP
jgi:hypothetical protein